MVYICRNEYLAHHGILGMHWGKRYGPPYPLGASDHSASEKKAGWRKSLDKKTKKYHSYDMSKYADKNGQMSMGKQISVHHKLEKKNVQAAYKNIKNNIDAYNYTKKRIEKGKNISEKEQFMFDERKKIMDQAISEIDKAIDFQATRKSGIDFVNKSIRGQQFKDNAVGSIGMTVAYNAGIAAMTAMGVPPTHLPRVMVIPDFTAGKATKYINENSKRVAAEKKYQSELKASKMKIDAAKKKNITQNEAASVAKSLKKNKDFLDFAKKESGTDFNKISDPEIKELIQMDYMENVLHLNW